MTKQEIKIKELARITELVALGNLSLLAEKTALEAEVRALGLQENGNNVQTLSPDNLAVGTLQVETATVVGTIAAIAQVETATVVGTIEAAGAGNASVVVTAAGMTGSPKTIAVAVANNDTAAQVAGKIRTALAADTDVTALFAVSGSDATVVLTKLVAGANDATLNISIDNGTCSGLTTAATSANTTAGHAGTGNATVIFTSANTTGSPITLSVAVTAGDNASAIAGKIRTALAGNANIDAQFTIGGTGASVVATSKDYFANDATLNISIADGTCNGITTAATSANTTAGVAASGSLTVTAGTVLCTADEEGLTIELPTAVSCSGQRVTVKKVDNGTGNIVISTYSTQTIDGQQTYTLDDQYDVVTVVSDGANWHIISKIAAD